MKRVAYSSIMTLPARRLAFLTAALLLAADSVSSADLDRLFYSPRERAALDAQRNQSAFAPGSSGDTVTVNGLVTRSSGKNTTWLNGVPRNENQPENGIEVLRREEGKITLRPPGKDAAVDLKAGQTLEGKARRVREPYERRHGGTEMEQE